MSKTKFEVIGLKTDKVITSRLEMVLTQLPYRRIKTFSKGP